jgi:hypothetical protein
MALDITDSFKLHYQLLRAGGMKMGALGALRKKLNETVCYTSASLYETNFVPLLTLSKS